VWGNGDSAAPSSSAALISGARVEY